MVPPLVGIAVKVTAVPVQILPAGNAVMLTDGTTAGLTDIVNKLDVAVEGFAQPEFEVSIQLTISLFDNDEFE